jgi:predicted nucleic acid-binding protein
VSQTPKHLRKSTPQIHAQPTKKLAALRLLQPLLVGVRLKLMYYNNIDENNLWIAAIALQNNLTVVSSDSDFLRIQQVRNFSLESWV